MASPSKQCSLTRSDVALEGLCFSLSAACDEHNQCYLANRLFSVKVEENVRLNSSDEKLSKREHFWQISSDVQCSAFLEGTWTRGQSADVGIPCWQQAYARAPIGLQIRPLYRDGSIKSILGHHWCDRQGKLALFSLLDLSAVFDIIDHHILRQRLQRSFEIGIAIQWFDLNLAERTWSVRLADTSNTPRKLVCGVPKGPIVGLYFLFYTLLIPVDQYTYT